MRDISLPHMSSLCAIRAFLQGAASCLASGSSASLREQITGKVASQRSFTFHSLANQELQRSFSIVSFAVIDFFG
jgi:hypothetical protein